MRTSDQRSRNMKAIKNRDTKIEIMLRQALYHNGYRYRKNYKKVFGKPDILFIKEKIAIFCDSEFWHGYDWENRKDDFKTNKNFWVTKIEKNIERDKLVNMRLEEQGFLVLRFWGEQIIRNLDEVVKIIVRSINERRSSLK